MRLGLEYSAFHASRFVVPRFMPERQLKVIFVVRNSTGQYVTCLHQPATNIERATLLMTVSIATTMTDSRQA